MIPTWSYSRLQVFQQCKFRAHLMYELKIAEPERPLPEGKTEHANDRGTRIHTAAENFVKGDGPFVREMTTFRPEFEKLQRLYPTGVVSIEGEWGLDRDWEPCEWKKAWGRMKLDYMVRMSPAKAIVVDLKSGRLFGNEVKHAEQAQLYQLNTFLRHPELEEVTTEFWYVDQNEITTMNYRRDQGLRFKRSWDKRATDMTTTNEFPASPNIFNCRYCGYGPWGTGHCVRGVQR